MSASTGAPAGSADRDAPLRSDSPSTPTFQDVSCPIFYIASDEASPTSLWPVKAVKGRWRGTSPSGYESRTLKIVCCLCARAGAGRFRTKCAVGHVVSCDLREAWTAPLDIDESGPHDVSRAVTRNGGRELPLVPSRGRIVMCSSSSTAGVVPDCAQERPREKPTKRDARYVSRGQASHSWRSLSRVELLLRRVARPSS